MAYDATVGSLADGLPLVPLIRDGGLWLELADAVTILDPVSTPAQRLDQMQPVPQQRAGIPRQVLAARKTVMIAVIAMIVILTVFSVELGLHGLMFFIQRPPGVGSSAG